MLYFTWQLMNDQHRRGSKPKCWRRFENASWQVNHVLPCLLTSCMHFRKRRAWFTLEWRHNGRDGVSNHQLHHCLLHFADQRKQQSSASLAFGTGDRWPVNSPHKWPGTWKMFPFDDAIMLSDVWRHSLIGYVTFWIARSVQHTSCLPRQHSWRQRPQFPDLLLIY